MFALPVLRLSSPGELLDWVAAGDQGAGRVQIIGTDESADTEVGRADLRGPLALVVGNETRGMSAAWRERCDQLVRIPIGGSASSLNAATAGAIVLYEAMRQRSGR